MISDAPDFKPKSFWEKPEGTTGMIFGVALLGGVGVVLYRLLPFIITLLENTLYTIFLVAVIGLIGYIAMDKRFRTLLWFVYKGAMRAVTKIVVEIDPIAIVENYIDSLKENLRNMNKQIGKLKGQMRTLANVIGENESKRQANIKMASKAKEMGKQNVLILKTRKAGRLQKSNVTLQTLLTKLEVLYRVLSKMYENGEYVLEDTADEVDVKKREYEAIKTSHNALKSAMSIINGDPDKKAIFDMAMDHMVDTIGSKVGEMERFMDISKNFMDSIDLQNGVFEDEGMEMLEQWESESVSFLLGDDKQFLIDTANNPKKVLKLNIDTKVKVPVKAKKKKKYL